VKVRKPFVFYRFDTKDGSFGQGTRDYFTAGSARAAFRAMVGPTEGYIVLGEDGTKLLVTGACVNRARVPSEFHDIMRRAQIAWKDALAVEDPGECAPDASAPAKKEEDEDEEAVGEEEDAWRDITPTAPPSGPPEHAFEWMVARPGVPVAQGVEHGESDPVGHDLAFQDAYDLFTSDGVFVVRPVAGRAGLVTVRKGLDFDAAKLGADAKALLRAWNIDTDAPSVMVDAAASEAPAPEAATIPEAPTAAEAAVVVVQALVAESASTPGGPGVLAPAPFVAKPGWEASRAATRSSARLFLISTVFTISL